MESIYCIENIASDEINELSIKLNAMQEVSHIKINKGSISFQCARPENIQIFLKDTPYVLKEVVNKKVREYVGSEEKKKHYYMFTNLNDEAEGKEIEEILSKYSVYENVELDFQNKLLTLVTDSSQAEKRIKRVVENVNPDIIVEQWKRPFRSQDLFDEKYIQSYIRIALLLIGGAIGLVTRSATSIMTYVGWIIALLVINERVVLGALKDLKKKNYLTEDIVFFVAMIGGWLYGAFVEALLVSILYQAGKQIILRLTHWSMEKIDAVLARDYTAKRLTKGEEEIIPLEDFDIGDILVVEQGQTIPLGGKIVEGFAKLDVYAIDGKDVVQDSHIGQEVFSGTVVSAGSLQIKTTALFDESAFTKVLEIAKRAPMSSSKTEILIGKLSSYFTKAIIILGMICCIVLPIINLHDNLPYLYLGVIMLTVSGSFAYVQGASYTLLAGIAKAFSKKISIKENSGLDDLNTCATIIYDRFDGVETSQDEMDLFEKIKKLNKQFIIFNDGPVDLENVEYHIYNNLTVEEKLKIMDQMMIVGPVAYIGDCDKDIALLQKASVAISRGGIHNQNVYKNSDIMLTDSNFDTIIDVFRIARKQKAINMENTFIGMFITTLVIILGSVFMMPWWLACVIYVLESILVLFNSVRLLQMK